MRVRGDLHTNTIWPVSVGTLLCQLAPLELRGLCDVMFVNSYDRAMSAITESYLQFLNEGTNTGESSGSLVSKHKSAAYPGASPPITAD